MTMKVSPGYKVGSMEPEVTWKEAKRAVRITRKRMPVTAAIFNSTANVSLPLVAFDACGRFKASSRSKLHSITLPLTFEA